MTCKMEKTACISICFLTLIAFGYSQLLCYDCDPEDDYGNCLNPANTSAKTSYCDGDFPNANATNSTLLCVSAYIRVDSNDAAINQTGIYRGCREQKQDVANFCDWFAQETNTANRTMISCASCNSTRCNTHTFTSHGVLNSSGVILTTNVMFVLIMTSIFNVVFCLL